MYYISSKDEACVDCEKLGWKRLEEYDPSHSRWKYLCLLADGSAVMPQEGPFEDEDFGSDVDYYLSLPFAALFSCCKVLLMVLKRNGTLVFSFYHYYGLWTLSSLNSQMCIFVTRQRG